MNIERYREIIAAVDEQTYESEHQRNLAIHKYMARENVADMSLAWSRRLREMKYGMN